MKYTPNFSDPRVIARCKQAIGFACGVMSTTKSHAWSSRYIDRYFGMSTNPLSKYLRDALLICTDDFYRFNSENNKCKEYRLNENGLRALCENLNFNTTIIYPSVIQVAKEDHSAELASGDFVYKDQSSRLWHPLQRYRKQYRTQVLCDSGYEHDYDIETCAPTLIHQFAQQCGMDEYCFAIHKYLNEKTQIREQLAVALDLESAAIKEVINALFAGAIISRHEESDISHILAGDSARIEYLKQDAFIQELVSDIKKCWTAIIDSDKIARRRNTQTNRLIRVSCKNKWHVYFELERVVIDSVRTYLDQNGMRYFLIHDGWTCENELDLNELELHVKNTTGYSIKFEHKKLTQQ
jgi:hypothetical protein